MKQCNRRPLRNKLASTFTNPRSESSQILGRRFASPAIGARLERHLLAFIKPLQATPSIMRRPSFLLWTRGCYISTTAKVMLK